MASVRVIKHAFHHYVYTPFMPTDLSNHVIVIINCCGSD